RSHAARPHGASPRRVDAGNPCRGGDPSARAAIHAARRRQGGPSRTADGVTAAHPPLASPRGKRINREILVAVTIIVAVIVYGSLYPFTSRQPEGGTGPLRNLLQSWADTPHRGDFVANVFFYLPLGFFLSLASAGRGRVIPRIMLVALAGAAL